jgi:hypothetical protein
VADLHVYEVPVRGHKTTMKLSEEDAKALYGDDAKRVGEAKKAEPQPVTRPPYDTGEVKDPADQDDAKKAEPESKKAPAPQNKARKA